MIVWCRFGLVYIKLARAAQLNKLLPLLLLPLKNKVVLLLFLLFHKKRHTREGSDFCDEVLQWDTCVLEM